MVILIPNTFFFLGSVVTVMCQLRHSTLSFKQCCACDTVF